VLKTKKRFTRDACSGSKVRLSEIGSEAAANQAGQRMCPRLARLSCVAQLRERITSVWWARRTRAIEAALAYYGEFVQSKRLKANSQFGAIRTGDSVMVDGVGAGDAVRSNVVVDGG
jgi:hypothetical protein